MARTYRVGAATRITNALFRTLTSLGLGARYRHVLTVRGRRSGQERSTPVDVMEHAGRRWLVAPYGETNWVRNARVAGEVGLTRGRRSERVRVVEVGPEEAVPVLRTYLREVAVTRPYFDVDLDSPDEAFAAEALRHPVFRIQE
jgi:deazaflavin-dependent oxidoreductase (nitroreductase family)